MAQSKSQSKSERQDYLKVDPPLPGQNWVCLSFVSPDDLIEKKMLFNLNRFLYYRVNRNISDQATQMTRDLNTIYRQKFEQQIQKLKSSVNEQDQLMATRLDQIRKDIHIDESEFMNRCMRTFRREQDELTDQYQMYLVENQAELDREFDMGNQDRTSVRGVKVRGVFNQRTEADARAKELQESVEPAFHVYVAPVGYWLPWDPNPDGVQDQEYMVPALNNIMKKYYNNVHERNQHYRARTQELQEQAEEGNVNTARTHARQTLMARREAKLRAEADKAMGLAPKK